MSSIHHQSDSVYSEDLPIPIQSKINQNYRKGLILPQSQNQLTNPHQQSQEAQPINYDKDMQDYVRQAVKHYRNQRAYSKQNLSKTNKSKGNIEGSTERRSSTEPNTQNDCKRQSINQLVLAINILDKIAGLSLEMQAVCEDYLSRHLQATTNNAAVSIVNGTQQKEPTQSNKKKTETNNDLIMELVSKIKHQIMSKKSIREIENNSEKISEVKTGSLTYQKQLVGENIKNQSTKEREKIVSRKGKNIQISGESAITNNSPILTPVAESIINLEGSSAQTQMPGKTEDKSPTNRLGAKLTQTIDQIVQSLVERGKDNNLKELSSPYTEKHSNGQNRSIGVVESKKQAKVTKKTKMESKLLQKNPSVQSQIQFKSTPFAAGKQQKITPQLLQKDKSISYVSNYMQIVQKANSIPTYQPRRKTIPESKNNRSNFQSYFKTKGYCQPTQSHIPPQKSNVTLLGNYYGSGESPKVPDVEFVIRLN